MVQNLGNCIDLNIFYKEHKNKYRLKIFIEKNEFTTQNCLNKLTVTISYTFNKINLLFSDAVTHVVLI